MRASLQSTSSSGGMAVMSTEVSFSVVFASTWRQVLLFD